MNKQQRKEIQDIFDSIETDSAHIARLDTPEAREDYAKEIESCKERLESVVIDEQEKLDNMPEGLRNGSKGEDMENAISELESAVTLLEEAAAAVRDDYPEGDKPATEDIEAWAEEVQSKIDEAESTSVAL